jgi:integrase
MWPKQLSSLWWSARKSLKLPRVSFHALRHTHPSRTDCRRSRRCGDQLVPGARQPDDNAQHLRHLFNKDDSAAALAIDAVMR